MSLFSLFVLIVLGLNPPLYAAKNSSQQQMVDLDLAWKHVAQLMLTDSKSALYAFQAGQVRIKQNDFKSAHVYLKKAKKNLAQDKNLDAESKKSLKVKIDQSLKAIK